MNLREDFLHFNSEKKRFLHQKLAIKRQNFSTMFSAVNFYPIEMLPIRIQQNNKLAKENGYMVFCEKYLPMLKKEYPNESPQNHVKMCAEMWRNLPDESKNSFIVFAENDRRLKSDPIILTTPVGSDGLQIIMSEWSPVINRGSSSSNDTTEETLFKKFFNLDNE
jgi:hypothetical protein